MIIHITPLGFAPSRNLIVFEMEDEEDLAPAETAIERIKAPDVAILAGAGVTILAPDLSDSDSEMDEVELDS